MFFVISLNESFAAVYLCGIFFILILIYSINADSLSKGFAFKFVLSAIITLAIAIILEAGALKLINMIFNVRPEVPAANQYVLWFKQPFLLTLKNLFFGSVYKYILMGKSYFPITVFVISGILSFIMTIYLAVKKRKPIIILLMFLLYLSIISLSLIKGVVLPYRTSSTLGIFAAFVFMLLLILFKNKWIKIIYGVLIVVLVVNQTRILSSWFNNDYLRYVKDKEMVVKISKDIEKDFDETKPVMFIGWVEQSPNLNRIEEEYNGVSFIGNYSDKREARNPFYYLLNDFFELHGHKFNIATQEQYLSGRIIAEDMPSYPKKGYIKEMDDYIIVNFN